MELNDLTRGEYSAPDTEPGKSLRNRYFISKRKMVFLVVMAVCLGILSAVIGTVISPSSKSSDSPDISTTIANRSRKKVDQITPKPSPINGPWKNFRLPKNLRPIHYDLTVRVNMSDSQFHGLVRIRFVVKVETRFILLHADQTRMRYKMLVIREMNHRLVKRKDTRAYESYLVVEVDEDLKRGRTYTISIQFYSVFHSYPQKGLYLLSNRRVYNAAKGLYEARKKMAVTFFAPVSARRNFPCFDEPSFKATFSLTLMYNRGYTSLSNMPLKTRRMTDKLVFDKFHTSIIMPTYMLNYVIFDYTSSGATTTNGTKLRLWSPRHTAGERSYALRVANATLPFYESFFGIRYSISKLDMTTVPVYPVVAMETWGLVNFVQSKVLVKDDDNRSSVLLQKQAIALLMSHEIVHQWFGNLATIKWWNDLVIHEGCATYLQYFGANHVEPSLELMDQFYNIEVRKAMMEDSLESTHAIARDVLSSKDIWTNIHLLMYRKGAAILRMLHKYVGDEAFFKGLKLYLKKFAYGNAAQDDLWDAFSETSKIDVTSIMRTWTTQPGFPVITANREKSGEILITQKRFLIGEANTGHNDRSIWKVPITYVTSKDPKKTRFYLLSSTTARLPVGQDAWFKFNTNADGYYIVNYDTKNWNSLSHQLNIDHSVFSILDRSSLIKDVFNLAEEGVVLYDVALNMTIYLTKEMHWIPWQYVKLFVSNVIMRLPMRSKTRQLLLKYYGKITGHLLEKYGWGEIKEGSLGARFLQETAVTAALNANDKKATEMASRLFRNWMTNQTRINPNIARVVYFYGVRNGGKEEWNRVYTAFIYERRKDEKLSLKNALAASKNSWTLSSFLHMAMYVRRKHIKKELQMVADSSSSGRYVAWNFVKQNWDRLYGSSSTDYAVDTYIKPVVAKFANVYYYNDVYSFFRRKFTSQMNRKKIQQILKEIRLNISWAKTGVPQIEAWLEKYAKYFQ